MAFSDLTQALGMFQQGVKDLAIQTGISNATAQVQDLNASVLDENQKRQAKTQLANQLQGQLAGLGATGEQIQAGVGSIAPPKIANAQDAYSQAVATGDSGLMKQAKDMQKFEEDPKTNQMNIAGQNAKDVANINGSYMLQAAGMKSAAKLTDKEYDLVKDYGKQFEATAKDKLQAREKATTAIQMLNSKNPVADVSVLNQLVKASGDVGNISEADRAGFGGSPAFLAKIKRAQSQFTKGTLDEDSRKLLLNVAAIYKKKAEDDVHQVADRYAKRASKMISGADVADLKSKIFPGFDEPVGTPAAPSRTPVTLKSKDGKLVQAYKDAQGKLWDSAN